MAWDQPIVQNVHNYYAETICTNRVLLCAGRSGQQRCRDASRSPGRRRLLWAGLNQV